MPCATAGMAVGLVKLQAVQAPAGGGAARRAGRCRRASWCSTATIRRGCGGVLHQELRAALYGMPEAPRIHGYLAGVGGVNVSPERIAAFVQQAQSTPALAESEWVR